MSLNRLKLLPVIVLLLPMVFCCEEKKRIKLNDESFVSCMSNDPLMLEQLNFFGKLTSLLEKRHINLTDPGPKKFYQAFKHLQTGSRHLRRGQALNWKELCQCESPKAFMSTERLKKVQDCLNMPEANILVNPTPDMIERFIENYEPGPAKTYVLTFLLFSVMV